MRRGVRIPRTFRRSQNVDDFRVGKSDVGQKEAANCHGKIGGRRSQSLEGSSEESGPKFFGFGERGVQLAEGLVVGVEGYQGLEGFGDRKVSENSIRVQALLSLGFFFAENLEKNWKSSELWETAQFYLVVN